MIILDFAQGTPEWLNARLGLATASRFSDVMATLKSGEAASRRNYRAELVVERLTGLPTPTYVSREMALGTEREPDARAEVEARLGVFVNTVGFCRHSTLRCGASPDGLIDSDGGLELKCPNRATHFSYMKLPPGECPPEYVAQVQGNLWITGRQWWLFVSYNPDFPEASNLVCRKVARDEAKIAKISDEVAKFVKEVDADEEFARNYIDKR